MGLTITELMPGFAAEVTGVDLRQPVDEGTVEAIRAAIDRHAVLVFRNQRFDDESQVAFSARIGPLETSIKAHAYKPGWRPEISRLSNVGPDGEHLPPTHEQVVFELANEVWHTDSSFKPVPAKYSLLSGREVPPAGGETEFADMRAAWDTWTGGGLGVQREEMEELICEHSIVYSRLCISGDVFGVVTQNQLPPVRHPLVRRHPVTGRAAFYAGSHCSHVVQWPVARGRELIYALNAHGVRAEHVYTHRWQPFDFVIWDNRCVLHRGRPFDRHRYRRVMHRTTVAGDGPTLPADAPHAQPSAEHPQPGGPHIVLLSPASPVPAGWQPGRRPGA